MSGIAFVTGCARSGTSILGELIGAHPDVAYRHEAHHIWRKAGRGENGSHRLTAANATPVVASDVRKRFLANASALVVEKNPRSMLRVPFIAAVFPEAKFVHIIRDGRDVACSLLPGIGGDEWRHLKPPSWHDLFATERGVVRCAKAWRDVLEIALHDLDAVSYLTVRYEDLVRDPQPVARDVLSFLGLPEHDNVAAFAGRVQNETAGSYQPQKQRKWYRDDHRVRVGRWRENLTFEEQRAVEEVLEPMLRRLGYETTAVRSAE